MVLAAAAQEGLWLKQLEEEINPQSKDRLMCISSNNQGAIKLAQNDAYHPSSKHIDVRYHFLRE